VTFHPPAAASPRWISSKIRTKSHARPCHQASSAPGPAKRNLAQTRPAPHQKRDRGPLRKLEKPSAYTFSRLLDLPSPTQYSTPRVHRQRSLDAAPWVSTSAVRVPIASTLTGSGRTVCTPGWAFGAEM